MTLVVKNMTRHQKLALIFLALVCLLDMLLLGVFAFAPSLYHLPLFGHSITLGIPLALVFMCTVFILMIYYVLSQAGKN